MEMQPRTIAWIFIACALGIGLHLCLNDPDHSLPRALQFMVYGAGILTGILVGVWRLPAAGIHPYTPRVEMWKQLTGKEVEKDNEFATKAKTWGIKNESAAVEVYAALRLNKSIMPNHTQYRHKTHRWLVGIPDALIVDTKTGKVEGILEVKCPYAPDMSRVVPHQTMSAIYYHMPQVQGYMEILDVEYCDLMSYTTKGSVIFRFMRDRAYWLEMLPALVEFWTHMRRDTPPSEKHANSKTLEK
ncbi:DNA binding nuclease [Acanthamoeba castellanii str. Neff]|uniref:DNA binding nuclease n=1 Tax=Acanthamoeba castellanii (strain ATCC 30010 / Neff) TaxID=1257118 RepID=L8HHP0_ACACF|nr:DNA binding nuclease [Acanthamoeba castellanii str. Neff]ELR23956.1 DNA binding nuclease [Acanthamoeba castellanii str. Neff]